MQGYLAIGTNITDREKTLIQISELKSRLEKENIQLKQQISEQVTQHKIIGKSEAIEYALNKAYQVAATDANVLFEGETGVGKELFAELIHEKSNRDQHPLFKMNCASLYKELIESELFGHEKGAFTGATKDISFAPSESSATSSIQYGTHLSLKEVEKKYIERVLEACQWKINGEVGAAERLKLHPSTLRSKMKKLGVQRDRSQRPSNSLLFTG